MTIRALLVINIAQIIVKSLPSSSGFSPVIAVSDALPPVLISRCLLNLWQAGQLEGDSSSATSHFTTLKFGSPNVVNTQVEFSSALDNTGDLDCDSEYGDKAVDWDGFDGILSDNIHGKENYSGVEFI
ncbi:hypothetical protein PHLCEN_2v4770 [Hermanssonia centrifuga]|uniref:Uncharacterized protein n=1 Tax=Hermanssonia centrifuga TaxID=98765 RepID=A0A2R6PJE4_9APHY|nr:hypothetical protein PHLCEN_2v4770 [Hermanssonia centrifuga]